MMCYKIIVLRLSETFRGLMLSNLNIDCSNSTRYGTRPLTKLNEFPDIFIQETKICNNVFFYSSIKFKLFDGIHS